MIPIRSFREYCNISTLYLQKSDTQSEVQIQKVTQGNTEKIQYNNTSQSLIEIDIKSGDFLFIKSSSETELTAYVRPNYSRKVHLNHIICTYKNEECVIKKIKELESLCNGEYTLTIIDNGHTLETQSNYNVTITHSPNYGGTAGFTRGVLECLKKNCTHVLLNDDDAQVDRETIFRTISFLKIISPEYYDYGLNGIMLDQKDPNIVYDAGAVLDNSSIVFISKNTDISKIEGISSLFEPCSIDYCSWTYACIPLESFKKNGLPLPLTIWFDDVEYGLRTQMKVLTVPGISAIHPRHDYATRRRYYHGRNLIITLSTSNRLDKRALDHIFDLIAIEIATYRYSFAKEMMEGIEDYLKGPDHNFSDLTEGLRPEPDLGCDSLSTLREELNETETPKPRNYYKRLLTLNGLFLPAFGDLESPEFDMDTSHYYRIRKVLYHLDGDTGFIAERNITRTLSLIFRAIVLKARVKMKLKRTIRAYQESLPKYTSEEYWSNLLCRDGKDSEKN